MKPSFLSACLAACLLAAASIGTAPAQQMNYQGRLTDSSGAPRPGPQATIAFSIWTAATAGTQVWGPFTINADLIDGRFSVKLGDSAGRDGSNRALSAAFSNPAGPRYLELKVGTDLPLPRQQILAAPTALFATHATTADTAANFTSVVLKTDEINQRVGIGTATPGSPLSFSNAPLGDKISLWSTANGLFGFGVDVSGLLQIYTPVSVNDIVFGYGRSATMTETMRIKGNGRVGIGTSNPTKGMLEVVGRGDPQLFTTLISIVSPGETNDFNNPGGFDYSMGIYSERAVGAQAFLTFSDQRIKRDLQRSDSSLDLSTLLAIRVTDYKYIDTAARGVRVQKKVIAQQVEEVYPQAVSISTDVVPDIFKKAAIKDGWVNLATDLRPGDRVRLIGEKAEGVHEVLETAVGRFRTDFNSDGAEVIVYGREVNDFRTVDYDAIAMLNVSATQQIKREKDAEVKALREENALLRTRIALLEAGDRRLEAQIATIEKLLEVPEQPVDHSISIKVGGGSR